MKNIKIKLSWNSTIMVLYVVAVLFGLPLVFRDYYFDILQVKYYFYCGSTLLMAALILGGCIFTGKFKGLRENVRFSPQDKAVLALGMIAAISTVLSPFVWESFWGNEGRFTGLFLMLLYVVAYFCITRLYKLADWHIHVFLFAGVLVCLFGITDFFDMDILHFKESIKETQRYIFTSTIGNINTYTSYVAMIMAAAGTLWATADGWKRNLWYGLCTCIGFVALILGESDNAYLSLAAFFGFLPLYLFRSMAGIRKYMMLVTVFFTVVQGIAAMCHMMADQAIQLQGIFKLFADFRFLYVVVVVLWGVTLVLFIKGLKEKNSQNERLVWPVRIWWGVIAAVVFLVVFALVDVNVLGHKERYGELGTYLYFNDDWGTHRGYIWRIGIENYKEFPILQKIFGYGPDTFGLITYFNNLKEMTGRYGEIFDNAHNEYLQYFITIGPLGLLAYVSSILLTCRNVVKKRIHEPLTVALLFAVICYAVQAVVNVNQTIVTPIMWTLMCICAAEEYKGSEKS